MVRGLFVFAIVLRVEASDVWARLDWSILLLFFASLFVAVEGVARSGVAGLVFAAVPVTDGTPGLVGALRTAGVFLVSSNVVTNVPFILLVVVELIVVPFLPLWGRRRSARTCGPLRGPAREGIAGRRGMITADAFLTGRPVKRPSPRGHDRGERVPDRAPGRRPGPGSRLTTGAAEPDGARRDPWGWRSAAPISSRSRASGRCGRGATARLSRGNAGRLRPPARVPADEGDTID